MSEDLVKILAIIAIVSFLIYYVLNALRKNNIIEGLENQTQPGKIEEAPQLPRGASWNAENYDKQIKNNVSKIKDMLLIPKYRKQYESIIIDTSDLIDGLMLKTVLDIPLIDHTDDALMARIKTLNDLFISKTALNGVMKYMDKVR